jgi:hypothetical protein
MSSWKVGDRVRVDITKPSIWHRGAFANLNGKVGTVEEVKSTYGQIDNYILVRFDIPVEPWHENALPHTAFHFDFDELLLLPPEEEGKKEDEAK